MIPLSNGRSPRIDQFYATLRTYKSHQFNEDFYNRSDQDKSIQQIRSLGKQILESQPSTKRIKLPKQTINILHKSTQSLSKPSNLYDKYKLNTNKKLTNVINNVKTQIVKQQLNKSQQKQKVNKKYELVPSKIQAKAGLKGLNYAKKVQMQAQKLKKQKLQVEKMQRQVKSKQNYFMKNSYMSTSFQQLGILKHAQQLKNRKQKHIQKIRTQQLQKQMSFVTFHPQLTSRKYKKIQPNFEKRNQLANTQRLSRQKLLLKQQIQNYTFIPQTNGYRNSNSKILQIWKSDTNANTHGNNASKNNIRIDSVIGEVRQDRTLNSNKSLKTANQTMQINLKSMNQISFIFQ